MKAPVEGNQHNHTTMKLTQTHYILYAVFLLVSLALVTRAATIQGSKTAYTEPRSVEEVPSEDLGPYTIPSTEPLVQAVPEVIRTDTPVAEVELRFPMLTKHLNMDEVRKKFSEEDLLIALEEFHENSHREEVRGLSRDPQTYFPLVTIFLAIRVSENGAAGREWGILRAEANTFRRQAGWAAATVNLNYDRWSRSKEGPFLQSLQRRYCPVGAENDPTGLNSNWLKNVTAWSEQFSR